MKTPRPVRARFPSARRSEKTSDALPTSPEEQGRLAYEKAVALLSYRARSESELRERLAEHGFDTAVLDATVAKLREQLLLDDGRFAAEQARLRTTSGGGARSRVRVERDLQRRGLSSEQAKSAATEAQREAGVDDTAVALQAAKKKLRSLVGLPPVEQRQKLLAYLGRQGHPFDAAKRAVNAALEGPAAGDDEDPAPDE